MLPELPAKLWLQILERYFPARRDLLSLSSTNRQLRELTLPLLFHCVEFQGFPARQSLLDGSSDTGYSYLKLLAPFYTRIIERVRWLQRRSHLLPHVRTCRLCGWSQLSELLEDDPDLLYLPLYGDALDCWVSAYEVLVGLIPMLPSLKVLAVVHSPITSALQSAFYLSPELETLMLSACESEVGHSSIARRQVTARLQDLAYEPPPSYAEHLGSSFKQLLRRSLPSLVSLKVPMDCIVGIAAIVAAHHHTLQHLVISESPFGPIDTEKVASIRNLLESCTGLKTLKIMGWVNCDLQELGKHAPPNLEYISGTPAVFQALVPGRPIHSVHIQYCALDPLTASSFNLSQPSTVLVQRVSLDFGANLPSNIINALASTFRHLTHLKIRFLRGYSAKRNATIEQQLWDPVSVAFPDLRVYHVVDVCELGQSDVVGACSEGDDDAECPVARRGDPGDRGHPAMEEVCLLSRFTWTWFPKEGWVCREFGPHR